VLGAGPCTASAEPIADFFDLFLIGDAEEALPRLLEAYREGRCRGLSSLARAPRRHREICVPSFYDVAYRVDGRIALAYLKDRFRRVRDARSTSRLRSACSRSSHRAREHGVFPVARHAAGVAMPPHLQSSVRI
jgi:radical SAM superfamily enzyme YgiQ (UPF0313 family)